MSNSPLLSFQTGQCWVSEGEPELGIGFVRASDAISVAIEFPAGGQARLYRKKTAPLRRLEFRIGEKAVPATGPSFSIEQIEARDGLYWYLGPQGEALCEKDLSPRLTFQRPLERFAAGQWAPLSAYSLRLASLKHRFQTASSPARGLIGPRALLLPHQLHVASEVSRRSLPRALLADEVGLGKTIEAGWILHRLWVTGRIRRVLVVTPEALVNQWFVELFKRFHLAFSVMPEDLVDESLVILSLESLDGLRARGALENTEWDLVIVDEAHRITWTEEKASPEYEVIAAFAQKAPGLLLLTATPELQGVAGHFSRLHLLDPHRFPSWSAYEKEHLRYQGVAELAQELLDAPKIATKTRQKLVKILDGKVEPEILANPASPEARRALALALVDYYGTGRVYFRNARNVVELEDFSFPKRHLQKHRLPSKTSAAFVKWLGEFARAHSTEKTLLICDSAKKAIEWEQKLKLEYSIKAVAFHEELSLLARDRNAAYFADSAGASILLCSQLGGEGRNFQQAAHLILVDLPVDPDALEQRIGRLDRIGQRSDIRLHVPYFPTERTEQIMRWHEEVFDSFRGPAPGGHAIYERYLADLAEPQDLDTLIDNARTDYQKLQAEIEAGRDRLIELNSFDRVEAPRLAQLISESEHTSELRSYLEQLFDGLGLVSDDLDTHSMYLEPGHSQYAGYLPGLGSEGVSFTLSRQQALVRDDLTFLSWDHPMVQGALESITQQEYGNVAIGVWAQPLLLIECTFVVEPAAIPPEWYAAEFFPTQPVRVVLEATGKDLTADWMARSLATALTPLPAQMNEAIRRLPVERIRGLIKKAKAQAEQACATARSRAEAQMNAAIDAELARLRSLQTKNALVSERELAWWGTRQTQLRLAYAHAQVRFDSFLLAVPTQLGG